MRSLIVLLALSSQSAADIPPEWISLDEYAFGNEVVVYAHFDSNIAPDRTKPFDRGRTVYRVADIFRQPKKGKQYKKGDLITLSPQWLGKKTDAFLLAASKGKWERPRRITKAVYAYLKATPPTWKSPEWIAYQSKHIASKDPVIEEQAFEELFACDIKDFSKVSAKLNAPLLRQLLTDPKTPVLRHRPCALMLAACADKKDVDLLKKIILKPTETQLLSIEDIVFAYLWLGGEPALKFIEQFWIVPKTQTVDGKTIKIAWHKKRAALIAIRNQFRFDSKLINPDRVRQSLQLSFKHNPDFIIFHIQTFTELSAWSRMPEVVASFAKFNRAHDQRDVLRFLLSLIHEDTDVKRVARARKELEKIRKSHPELVKRVERYYPGR